MGGQVSAEKHHESAVVHANNVVYIHDAMVLPPYALEYF